MNKIKVTFPRPGKIDPETKFSNDEFYQCLMNRTDQMFCNPWIRYKRDEQQFTGENKENNSEYFIYIFSKGKYYRKDESWINKNTSHWLFHTELF